MGWRTALPKKRYGDGGDIFRSEDSPPPVSSRTPRFSGRLSIFTSSSTPSTPRLRCRTTSTPAAASLISDTESAALIAPKIGMALKSPKSARFATDPSSPKSPLILFRNSFRSRRGCGVCGKSAKSCGGTAVYTAQCGHVFHFPCISTHVRGTSGKKLTCLVCNAEWSDDPLLSVHQNLPYQSQLTYDSVGIEKKRVISAQKPPLQLSSSPKTTPVQIICYDDDEPLAFNSISVSEDEDDDMRTVMKFRAERNESNVEIRLMPDAALISTNSDHHTCALVMKVKAPQLPQTARRSHQAPLLDASRRAPIDLVTVLDVSGSMRGDKMQMMRRAMRLVISSLGPLDRLSIVAFSAVPKRLLPFKRMTQSGQRAAWNIVDRLECGHGSCVSDALRKASKVLEDRRERNPVATIILLSDAQDDSSKSQRTAPPPRHQSTTRFAHAEIPVDSPVDSTFAKWIGGLLSVVSQDVRIELGFAHDSPPAEIMAVYCSEKQNSLLRSSTVAIGDLYAEEEREFLVELRVPISSVPLEKTLTVKCSYSNHATHERIIATQEFIIPQPCLSPGIQCIRNVFICTRAVAESRQIVQLGEFGIAHGLLLSARDLLIRLAANEFASLLEAEIMELGRWMQVQQIEERERVIQQKIFEVTPHVTRRSSTGKRSIG